MAQAQELASLCAHSKTLCAGHSSIKSRLERPFENGDARSLIAINENLGALYKEADVVVSQNGWGSAAAADAVYEDLFALQDAVFKLDLPPAQKIENCSQALGVLEERLKILMADAGKSPAKAQRVALVARLEDIDAGGAHLWNFLHAATEAADYRGDRSLTEQAINPLHERVAQLSLSLRYAAGTLEYMSALQSSAQTRVPGNRRRHGLAKIKNLLFDPFRGHRNRDAPVVLAQDQAAVSGAPALDRPRAAGLARLPLLPSSHRHPPSEIFPIEGFINEDSQRDETRRIALMKEAGSTHTIGNPEGRARYFFKQDGNTCGIAAQILVMMEAGLIGLDAASAKAAEEAFLDIALRKRFYTVYPDSYLPDSCEDCEQNDHGGPRYNGGTPVDHMGSLLPMPVVKRYTASPEDLFAAVSRGKAVIVYADVGKLRNRPDLVGWWHIFIITGAEVDNFNGQLLGYYINDTLDDAGGRFITAAQFLDAWNTSFGRFFVAPL